MFNFFDHQENKPTIAGLIALLAVIPTFLTIGYFLGWVIS